MPENLTRRVKALLTESGCVFVRQGKGDHEIWFSPVSNRRFMIDNHIKSRHWANYTLKQPAQSLLMRA
jgi:HicA toxin of bacterial toxin-antitoxin,